MTTAQRTPPRVPDKPGLWWRFDTDGKQVPVLVCGWSHEADGLYYVLLGNDVQPAVIDDGRWVAPCLTPAEMVQELMELRAELLRARKEESLRGAFEVALSKSSERYGVERAATALGLTLPEPEGGR